MVLCVSHWSFSPSNTAGLSGLLKTRLYNVAYSYVSPMLKLKTIFVYQTGVRLILGHLMNGHIVAIQQYCYLPKCQLHIRKPISRLYYSLYFVFLNVFYRIKQFFCAVYIDTEINMNVQLNNLFVMVYYFFHNVRHI